MASVALNGVMCFRAAAKMSGAGFESSASSAEVTASTKSPIWAVFMWWSTSSALPEEASTIV